MQYDFVVVGAGCAGVIVASRLAQKKMGSVALIEASSGFHLLRAMSYMTGHPDDYEEWSSVAGEEWNNNNVQPYFNRILLPHQPLQKIHPLSKAFLHAGQECGFSLSDSFIYPNESLGAFQCHSKNGKRFSIGDVYLPQGKKTQYLNLLTNTVVERLAFTRGEGVELVCRSAKSTKRISARKQIILCLGAVKTPELLLRSGVGPKEILENASIKVIHALEGLGQNLQNHIAAKISLPHTHFSFHHLNYLLKSLGGKRFKHDAEVGGFARSSDELSKPDLQFSFMPNDDAGVSLNVTLLNPKSKGYIDLDPKTKSLRVFPQLLQDITDHQIMVKGLQKLIALTKSQALSSHLDPNQLIDLQKLSELDLGSIVRKSLQSSYNPAGTCRMGNDPLAVVDENLALRGVPKVSIVDASVMPKITTGNTQTPTMMIAEKYVEKHLPKLLK